MRIPDVALADLARLIAGELERRPEEREIGARGLEELRGWVAPALRRRGFGNLATRVERAPAAYVRRAGTRPGDG